MSGYIKLHRSLLEKWLWRDKPFAKGQAWIDLICLAKFKTEKFSYKNVIIEGERGVVYKSISCLADRWGWSRDKTRAFLKQLESDGSIIMSVTTHHTTVTLLNYGFYQDVVTTNPTTSRQEFSENLREFDVKTTQKPYNKSYNQNPDIVQKISDKVTTNYATSRQQIDNKPTANRQQADTSNKINKGNKRKYNNAQKNCACDFFEALWKEYPKKKGKSAVTTKALNEIAQVGAENMKRAIERYKKEISDNGVDEKFVMYGSTFFNGRYKEYLEAAEPEEKSKDKSTQYYEELARKFNMTVEEVKKQIEKQRNY